MCARFTYLTYDEVTDAVQRIEACAPLIVEPDWPAVRTSAYPKSFVTVIKNDAHQGLVPAELHWGYRVDWQRDVIFNTRVESLSKALWRDSIAHRRCVVPAFSFFEPHRSEQSLSSRTHKPVKRPYEFTEPNHGLLLMAGIWNGEDFSILTTEANAAVRAVHSRMPLVLEQQELPLWFEGDYHSLQDRSAIALTSTPTMPLLDQM